MSYTPARYRFPDVETWLALMPEKHEEQEWPNFDQTTVGTVIPLFGTGNFYKTFEPVAEGEEAPAPELVPGFHVDALWLNGVEPKGWAQYAITPTNPVHKFMGY